MDRWGGRLTGIEVDESWEALNVLVSGGLIRPTTIKLPLEMASLSKDGLAFTEVTTAQAFAREVPPVAAPARPLSAATPVSMPGTRLAGALVAQRSRRLAGLLLSRGGSLYTMPVDQVTFTGKELHPAGQADSLTRYYADEEFAEAVREAITGHHILNGDELRTLEISVAGGNAVITGSVRTKQVREAIQTAAQTVTGLGSVDVRVIDDLDIEFEIGQVLYQAGVSRTAEVYPRSALGEVSLFGYADTKDSAAEAMRVASRVPGVRTVHDRLDIRRSQPAMA